MKTEPITFVDLLSGLTKDERRLLRQLARGNVTHYLSGWSLDERGLITATLLEKTTKEVTKVVGEDHKTSTEVRERWDLKITPAGRNVINREREYIPEWVKLVRGDDWGHPYFQRACYDGLTCSRSKQAIELKDEALVRWPDGSTSTLKVESYTTTENVPDHGHTYTANSIVPCLIADMRGVESRVELDQVEIHKDSFVRIP